MKTGEGKIDIDIFTSLSSVWVWSLDVSASTFRTVLMKKVLKL